MKKLIIILLLLMAASLIAEENLVWIEAIPDTIYYDGNLTYSEITVKVENEFEEPVQDVYVTFECSIGNIINGIFTNEDGLALTTFWESGDIGVATINAVRNGQVLSTNVTILPPVNSPETNVPDMIDNFQIYPNPFNPETTISFSLEYGADVLIDIYNLRGQRIERLLEKRLEAGVNEISWNAHNKASGIYFFRINMGSKTKIKKMILMK